MSPFYTANGDDGFTGLLGEGRIAKNAPRIEAIGTLDEATAAIGLARSLSKSDPVRSLLIHLQRDLYHIMAEVAATPENASRFRRIQEEQVEWLEQQTETISQSISIPKEFILPGDSPAGGALSLARAIVRRAERRVVALFHEGDIENLELVRYLNRLSSLLFLLELFEISLDKPDSPTLAKEVS